MKNDYDIAIVGCGPAGATLARLIGPRYRVLVIDPKTADNDKTRKPCGGLLSPDAQRALSRFDLTLPKEILVDPQIFAVKTVDAESGMVRHYPRSYLNMDRHKFDLWLAGLIPTHVERFCGRCTMLSRWDDDFRLQLKRNDGTLCSITAHYVVGADGANSLVRRTLFAEKKLPHYVAVQQWFAADHRDPFYSCVFDHRTGDCCSWSISKDDIFIFGGVFPTQGCRERFEQTKRALTGFGYHFGKPLRTEACLVLRPRTPRNFCCGGDNAFLIGEAAGFISPSSFEGISWGVSSGQLLADVFNSPHRQLNTIYRRKTFSIRLRLSLKLLKCPFLYHPTLRRLVMRSRIATVRIHQ